MKDLWTQTAELMAEQTGYLEKKSTSDLDSKTGNAGYGNYTKYARDVNSWGQPGCQGQPWCAVYQFWICVQIFGLSQGLKIMGNGFYNCNSIKNQARINGTWHSEPKLGALVIFRNGAHIGRITKVTSSQIYTNEGNTSKGGINNVVSNGGMVCDKVYTKDYSGIDGYVWIDYETTSQVPEKNFLSRGDQGEQVKNLQKQLISLDYSCGDTGADGDFGEDTEKAVKAFQKEHDLASDGAAGPETIKKLEREIFKQGHTLKDFQRFVGIVTKKAVVHENPAKKSAAIQEWPQLNVGNLVDVLGRDGYQNNWYKVCVADQYIGYAWAGSIEKT